MTAGPIVWLASYPKSGNTWVRALLANYLDGGDTPADINRLGGGPIASSRNAFDELAGIEASALGDAAVERLRPDVYRHLAGEATTTFHAKVHDAWGLTDRGEPLFPAEITRGVLYVLRNPLDLAASCAHHWGVDLTWAVRNLCDSGFSTRRRTGALQDQLPHRIGSWSDHVRSWVDESDLPVHVVRYEDLHCAPASTFTGVICFYGLPHDPERVRRAVELSSFSELRRQEEEGGFRERSTAAPGPFFRRGEVDSWRDELPGALAERLVEAHAETMLRFGYLDGVGRP